VECVWPTRPQRPSDGFNAMHPEENKAYIVVQFVRQGRYGAVAVEMLRENGSSTIREADSINLERRTRTI
jgi:hypothetical protein